MLAHRKKKLFNSQINHHIKRSVLYAISSQNDDVGDLEKFHSDSLQISNYPFRILWFLIGLICFTICCYQVYDRIAYYSSSPTTTDVLTSSEPVTMPPLRIGGVDTDLLKPYWNLSKVDVSSQTCTDLFKIFWGSTPVIKNHTDFWEATNILPNVKRVTVREGEHDLANVEFNNGKFVHSFNPNLINWYNRNVFRGSHTVFELTKKIKLKTVLTIELLHTGWCHVSGFMLASENLLPQYHSIVANFGLIVDYLYSIKTNIFLNRDNSPCVSGDVMKKCYHDCLVKLFSKSECRLPFMPAEVKIPDCSKKQDPMMYINVTVDAAKIIEGTLPEKHCGCHKTCKQKSLILKLTFTNINDTKILRLNYLSHDDAVTIRREKLSYDGIHLLVDIGGSLCLFLGLCILSIIKIIHSTVTRFYQTTNDTSSSKFSKKYNNAVHKELTKILKLQTRPISYWITVLKICVIVTLIIFFVGLMSQKIVFYFSNPVTTVITITVLYTVHLPNVIACSDSNQTVSLKKEFAERNDVNVCEVHFLDLLPMVENASVEELWKIKTIFMQKDVINPIFTSQIIPMHTGTCYEVVFNKSRSYPDRPIYTGFAFKSFKTENCSSEDQFGFYVRSPGSNIYSTMMNKIDLVSGSQDAIYVETFRTSQYNSSSKPCVTTEQFETCAKNCYENKIRNLIHCRLPFLTTNTFQKWCDTVELAKAAYFAYLDIIYRTDVRRDCKCLPQCVKEMYKLYWLTQMASDYDTFIMITPFNNLIENLVEIPVYGLIALLCDFGNILGISLGLSLLSISHISLAFYKTLHNRYMTKTKIASKY